MREPSDTLRRHMVLALVLACALGAQQPAANATGRVVTIRGRVVDGNGEALPKAGVVVSTDPDFTTATALSRPRVRCGADGSFEVAIEPSKKRGASTELLIAAPGKVAFQVPNLEQLVFTTASRHPTRVDLGVLCLPDGFTMTGRVRGPDGKPLAGARIHATDCLTTYPWMAAGFGSRATTNASGVFVLAGVFAQAMAITVGADGCYERRLQCVDLAQPLDVQLEASGYVEGTLLDETGRPVEAFVHLAYELLGATHGGGVRAVAGRWKLPILQACRFYVHASREGNMFEWWLGPQATSDLLAGPTQGVELRFGAGAAQGFKITAVDGGGAKVASIRAAYLPDGIAEQVEDRMQRFVSGSGPDGAVRVRSPFSRGVNCVVVFADGFAPFLDKKVAWQDGGSYEAKLVPECRIAGRVLDAATGQPVAGAVVTCERVRQKVEESMPIVPVVTAADGSFTWPGLGAQPCLVTARHADGTATVSKRVKWKGPGEQQDVELSLPAGVTVSGKVTGPLQPRWRVQLVPPRSVHDRLPSFHETGIDELGLSSASALVDGAFRFEHRGEAMDELVLVVPLPPRQGGALRVPLEKVITRKGDEVVDVDVSKVLPGAITGKVTLRGADFPVGRLAVVAVRSGANGQAEDDAEERLGRRSWQLAGADGGFRIPAVAGKYTLQAIDVGTGVALFSAREEIEVASGASRTQDLAIDVVEVQVVCDAGGRKVLCATRVEVHAGERGDWEPPLFGGGMYGVPGAEIDQATRSARLFVPPGGFRLRVRVGAQPKDGLFSWDNQAAAEETIDATPGKVNEVRLELPEPAEPAGK